MLYICVSWKSFVCSSLYAHFTFERLQIHWNNKVGVAKLQAATVLFPMAIRKSFGHIITTIFNYLIQCINLQSVMVFS